MFFDVDHISCSSQNSQDLKKWFLDHGYTQKFEEKDVRNIQSKKELMHHSTEGHHLFFLEHPTNFNVEITEYQQYCHDCTSFIGQIELEEQRNSSLELKKLGMQIEVIEKNTRDTEGFFQNIIIEVENVEKASEFWGYFGFQKVESHNRSRLKFQSILSKKEFRLHLRKGIPKIPKIDAIGFNSIAFISNHLENDICALKEKEIAVSNIEIVKVNQAFLKIAFVKEVKYGIIELIGL
jgi:hypothetical protein